MVGRRKGTVFLALDLMKSYHQLRMADGDKEKTAFICPNGLFQYRRPFWLDKCIGDIPKIYDQFA